MSTTGGDGRSLCSWHFLLLKWLKVNESPCYFPSFVKNWTSSKISKLELLQANEEIYCQTQFVHSYQNAKNIKLYENGKNYPLLLPFAYNFKHTLRYEVVFVRVNERTRNLEILTCELFHKDILFRLQLALCLERAQSFSGKYYKKLVNKYTSSFWTF